jgi:DNA polymerase III subunit epsilon
MTFWKKWFEPTVQHPPFVKQYLQAFEQRTDRQMPVDQLRFVVFDTETSGLEPKKARLLALGAVVVQHNSLPVQESLEVTAYTPSTEISDHVAIHGITRRALESGMDEKEILRSWFSFIGNAVLVAHHAAFDLAMINQLSKKHFGIKLNNETIDTAHLAKRLEQGTQLNEYIRHEDYSLDRLCERYNIRPHDRHTAAGDAYITAKLLLKLLSKAKKAGIRTCGALLC